MTATIATCLTKGSERMKNTPNQRREYKIEEVDKSFSQFTLGFKIKTTGEPVRCYIEGCTEVAEWQVNVVTEKNTSILICWKHNEEKYDKGKRGSGAMEYILGEAEAKRRDGT